jgi:hypothetical protein
MMKKIMTVSVVCLMVLFVGMPAMAGGNGWGKLCFGDCAPCVLKSGNHQLPNGVWSETLVYGTEGEGGNILFAKGDRIWTFEDAKLSSVVTPVWGISDSTEIPTCYLTTYSDGVFTFKPPCCRTPLVSKNVTAFNYACKPEEGILSFTVYFSGVFDNTEISYEAVGHYTGRPMVQTFDGDVKVVMGGRLDSVTLVINGDVTDYCKPPKPGKLGR